MKQVGAQKLFHGVEDQAVQRALTDIAQIAASANDNTRTYVVTIPLEIGTLAAELVPGTADQVFVTNHAATTAQWGSVDLSQSAAVGSSILAQPNVARAVAGMPITTAVTLTLKTTAGTVDATAYTVPASPTGNNRFSLHRLRVRLKTAISGTGSVVIRAGTSVGGNDVLVDSASWTNATAAGTEIGISIADFGTAFLAATGYVAELAASAAISVRATTTGTLSAGDVEIFTYGAYAS